MPGKRLRVLQIEDSEDDALLIQQALQRGGYEVTSERTDTPEALQRLLRNQAWDVILADYSMPGFDGLAALAIVRGAGLDIPFILVSGVIGEDNAVAAMKAGANDYIMKGNLRRLVPAVERELRDAKIRRERTQAEQELRISERKFRSLFEGAADGILVLDSAGAIQDINPSGETTFGRNRAELVGHEVIEFMEPGDASRVQDFLASVLATRSVAGPINVVARASDGSGRVLSARASLVQISGYQVSVVMVIRDVTEMKELQAQLLQSERLASLGQISGFIVHEINTPLTAISLLSSRIATRTKDPDIKPLLDKVDEQRRRVSAMVSNLMKFSRHQRTERVDTDMQSVVQAALEQVDSFRKADVELVVEVGDRPARARTDPAQMQIVLGNLLRNAFEATSHGSVKVGLEADATGVRISVADTGVGIPPEVLPRLFTPFYSTKAALGGTGLGLAWSRILVEANGGTLTVSSEPGRGSVFLLVLPSNAEQPTATPMRGGGSTPPQDDAPADVGPSPLSVSTSR